MFIIANFCNLTLISWHQNVTSDIVDIHLIALNLFRSKITHRKKDSRIAVPRLALKHKTMIIVICKHFCHSSTMKSLIGQTSLTDLLILHQKDKDCLILSCILVVCFAALWDNFSSTPKKTLTPNFQAKIKISFPCIPHSHVNNI